MIDWRKQPRYPGDTIAEVPIYRASEQGFVCVHHFETFLMVSTFVPGRMIQLPGDTPKTEPELSDTFEVEDRTGAEQCFDRYLRDAQDAGWVIPLSTGDDRVKP
jgi:hypothetical protein